MKKDLSKEIKDINTITQMKNSLNGLNSRMEMTEERLSELEDRSIEII